MDAKEYPQDFRFLGPGPDTAERIIPFFCAKATFKPRRALPVQHGAEPAALFFISCRLTLAHKAGEYAPAAAPAPVGVGSVKRIGSYMADTFSQQ